MKKKIFICLLLMVSFISLSACGKKELNLSDYLIEERYNIYSASDDNYLVTFSTGLREQNYELDGVKNEMQEFGILTISKLNNTAMKQTEYNYNITIGEKNITGVLNKDDYYNGSYTVDVETGALNDEPVSVIISFTNYTFNKQLVNNSKDFSVDKTAALEIANKELSKDVQNLTKDKNNKIEVVMKIINDYSSGDEKNYYWYVGVVNTNSETIGILIDANNGDIISKKV